MAKKTDVKVLSGDQAALLSEGCKLNAQKKAIEARLKEIKSEMKINKIGTYTNKANDKVVISEVQNYSPVDPKLLFKYMRENKMTKHYWSCVKVQLTPLKKQIAESKYNKWRNKLDITFKWAFK